MRFCTPIYAVPLAASTLPSMSRYLSALYVSVKLFCEIRQFDLIASPEIKAFSGKIGVKTDKWERLSFYLAIKVFVD